MSDNKILKYTPKDYLKMIVNEHDMFVPYDEVDAEKVGTSTKSFVMCKGEHLVNLYRYKKSKPQSHIITCVDNYIESSTEEEFKNLKIPVVLKSARYDDKEYTISEVTASQLAEVFNINSPYISYVNDNPQLIMSVDFLGKRNQMESFADMIDNHKIGRIHPISLWIDYFNEETEKEKYKNIQPEIKKQLLLDLIRAFLIRRAVLMDNDLNSGNLGFIFNKDFSEMSLISFDYEYCFNNNSKIVDMTKAIPKDFIEKNVIWLSKYYPNELQIIINELSLTGEQKQQICDILDEYKVSSGMRDYWKRIIFQNVQKLQGMGVTALRENASERELKD